ncbi:hypothetical protein BBP40_010330 [Aspergillus hancockii]|nr:hypothetical protein BBP40_010330 [Aspergillus hancockii]
MANGGIITPLLGALQACVSVLLTMSYGVAAQRLRLIQESSINDMAGLGVKLFLPALIVINLESKAISRAQSYFLLCAVVSKTIGYAVGPKMLQASDSASDTESQDQDYDQDPETQNGTAEPDDQPDEETSLLPAQARKARHNISRSVRPVTRLISYVLPRRVRQRLMAPFESPFADVAIVCTLTGVVLGLVPQLHTAFFNKSEEGGIFNAWLTSSIKNIGKLFTTFQIFIVGCKLGVSFERMKASRGSGKMPLRAIGTIFLVRISIAVIYGLASKTNILPSDSILWFSLMLMPAGPPALVISGLAELAKVSELEKMAIAKTLTVMYVLSPFICFSITGALKASEAALEQRVST